MLYDALVAESRRNDSLDDVRSAALDRVRWLVDLLERQRTVSRWDAFTWQGREGYERFRAMCAATQAEVDGWLAACVGEECRATILPRRPTAGQRRRWAPGALRRSAVSGRGGGGLSLLAAGAQLLSDDRVLTFPMDRLALGLEIDQAIEARVGMPI